MFANLLINKKGYVTLQDSYNARWYFVYKLFNAKTKSVYYGCTVNPTARFAIHMSKSHIPNMDDDIRKNPKDFKMRIVGVYKTAAAASNREVKLILSAKRKNKVCVYNQTTPVYSDPRLLS